MADRFVPCNGCTLCCHKDAVRLMPEEDDITLYQTEPHPLKPGELMLAHKENGDCFYLGKDGCTIHSFRPAQCRSMDCRLIATKITKKQAKGLERSGLNMAVWHKGKEMLIELEKEQSKFEAP